MRAMTYPLYHHKPDIFKTIRDGFSHVAQNAQHVRIRHDLLAEYARHLPVRHPASVFDTEHHYIGAPEDTAAYVLALDAINYGSGFKDALIHEGWQPVEGSIYYAMSVRLKRQFEKAPLTAYDLAQITDERVREILEMPAAPQSLILSRLFAQGLRDLGGMVVSDHSACFLTFVQAADGYAANMVERLAGLPQFADIHDYHGHQIALYKRAQIAAADLHLAFARLGIHLFSDMRDLTMFPDNGVPQVLSADGLMEYDAPLREMIAMGKEIPCGSDAEIEIRACAGQVVEELARLCGKTAVEVDHILWHRHAEDSRYRNHPSHKTLCIYY